MGDHFVPNKKLMIEISEKNSKLSLPKRTITMTVVITVIDTLRSKNEYIDFSMRKSFIPFNRPIPYEVFAYLVALLKALYLPKVSLYVESFKGI